MPSAILLTHCPDQPGLVRAVASFIAENGGNIIQFDQHVDTQAGIFFMRAEWDLENFVIPRTDLPVFIRALAEPRRMTWSLHFSDQRHRLALFVSKDAHCLYDLLSRHEAGELEADIPLIVANHETLRPAAERFGIPFHVIPVTSATKAEAESRQRALIDDHNIDTIVLARYMQILSDEFASAYPNRIINIHHSFLPAFPGAKPYHSAHARGVKIIGATSHYVTGDLDEGPIIEQDVIRVTHRQTVADLVRQGRDLEKVVLSRAVRWHAQRKVLAYNNKTVIFV
ncbi:MAG: formyltetrahydrofolate deformylase [Verrucomicrobia bacterium]|jgi:formyltetrahydrofolate deformylase|nr:MAG: formyltetrahydrofolate deformylase [Verrucomicrobiota bacterium]